MMLNIDTESQYPDTFMLVQKETRTVPLHTASSELKPVIDTKLLVNVAKLSQMSRQ